MLFEIILVLLLDTYTKDQKYKYKLDTTSHIQKHRKDSLEDF